MTGINEYRHPLVSNVPAIAGTEKILRASVDFQLDLMDSALQFQIAFLDFFARRCQEDAKLMGDLVRSSEYNDVLDVAGEFVRGAKADYAFEASKMLLIGSNFAAQAANRIRKNASENLENLAARTVG